MKLRIGVPVSLLICLRQIFCILQTVSFCIVRATVATVFREAVD